MNDYGQRLASLVDEAFAKEVAKTDDGFRTHLGASIAGKPCQRQIYYAFRWADKEPFSGRMLRLFERGQLEEERFTKLLRLIGATVYTHDGNGKQFRVSAFGGHFGGSCDGVATGLPEIDVPVLVEMKTFNAKSFAKLVADGVHVAKPEHVKQANVYMHFLELTKCLYCAINKDTDELYFELFDYQPDTAAQTLQRAESIIFGSGLPPKISDTPGFWLCRFCSFANVCWGGKKPLQNCRTCQFAKPERDGSWSCGKGMKEIGTQPKIGCQNYELMNDLKS